MGVLPDIVFTGGQMGVLPDIVFTGEVQFTCDGANHIKNSHTYDTQHNSYKIA